MDMTYVVLVPYQQFEIGVIVDLFNKTDFTASKPDFLSMPVNMLKIPKLTEIVFVGSNILLILSIL